MALSPGTLGPIVPFYGKGSGQSATPISLLMAASQSIQPGDILSAADCRVSVSNANPANTVIIGVALDKKTTPATVGDSDIIAVEIATPGKTFVGSYVEGAAAGTDAVVGTSTSVVLATLDAGSAAVIQNQVGFNEDPPVPTGTGSGLALLDAAAANETAYIIGFAQEQMRGKRLITSGGAGVATTNPRMYFAFFATAFPAFL